MNQIRLRPDLKLEGSGALEPPVVSFERFKANQGLYVLSPDIAGKTAVAMMEAHQRQVDFLEGHDGVASAVEAAQPRQIELSVAQLRGHQMAVTVLADLTRPVAIVPPVDLVEQPLVQLAA